MSTDATRARSIDPDVPDDGGPVVVDDTEPTVVADHVSVTYRLYADQQRAKQRFLRRSSTRVHRSVEALKDISFVAHRGEAIGVIGHNGSGKSTLLRAISGLLPLATGRVFTSSTPVLLGVSAAFQKDLSGRRNVILGATARGLSRQEIDAVFDDIVEFAGLGDFIDLPLRAYSSGMRARLQFAIATATTPEILIVDEALATGDASFKERSDERIQGFLKGAGTVFVATHVMSSVTDICTRALWLDRGELIAEGDPELITQEYRAHNERVKQARARYGRE